MQLAPAVVDADEELRAVGVGPGVGHGDGADGVLAAHRLVGEAVARAASTGALGIAALDDELGHDAVEGRAPCRSRPWLGRRSCCTVTGASFGSSSMVISPRLVPSDHLVDDVLDRSASRGAGPCRTVTCRAVAHPLDARERAQLCLRFDELGPDAPTLCEGWATFDLAAHLVVPRAQPARRPGILLGEQVEALGRATAKAMAKEKASGYDAVVERIRTGPPPGPFAVPGLRTQLNLIEYVVHHEDVRRANGFDVRTGIDDLQDAAWPLLRPPVEARPPPSARRRRRGAGATPGGAAKVAKRGTATCVPPASRIELSSGPTAARLTPRSSSTATRTTSPLVRAARPVDLTAVSGP